MLIRPTEDGLWCEAGGFHVDPWRPVARAVVTHAHSDHARAGCGTYLSSARGVGTLRERVGASASVEGLAFGEARRVGDAVVSLHPAGHVLGSAQVRVECARTGEVWVVTGDFKVASDPTCDPFEPVRCHTLVTESTFGLPIYRWRPSGEVFAEINAWWRANASEGRTSVLHAYALGKAQRLLAGVDASIGPILVHGSVARFLPRYEAEGVRLPTVLRTGDEGAAGVRGKGLVVAPASASGSGWMRRFGECSEAAASGWMRVRGARRRGGIDRGFVLSDHADWDGLLLAVEASGASRVFVTHGFARELARWLGERDLETGVFATRYEGEAAEPRDGEEAPAGAPGPEEGAAS